MRRTGTLDVRPGGMAPATAGRAKMRAANRTGPIRGRSVGESATRPLILLAEDERALRLMLRQTLTRAGFRVVSVASGRALVRAFHKSCPCADLVITDVEMPGGNGLAAVEQIRKAGNDLPVIVISGSDVCHHDAATTVGATAFVEKPVALAGLLALAVALTG